MNTLITEDIKVSVESVYQPEYSNADKQHFLYAYRITIENLSTETVQLKKDIGKYLILLENTKQ